jgi:hypothetical protein
VYFDKPARDFVWKNGFRSVAKLLSMVDHGDRDVPEFPRDAAVIKTIWRRVPLNGVLQLGTWDPSYSVSRVPAPGGSCDCAGVPTAMPEEKWPTCVNITVGKHQANETRSCGPKHVPGRYVSADDFYNFEVTDPVSQSALLPPGQTVLERGDRMILVGMHLTTKEIPSWFWATFWWTPPRYADLRPQPLIDRQNSEMADQPADLKSRPQWNHYMTDTTVSLTKPPDPDGRAKRGFNPYLEAALTPAGTSSNCMVCHSQASLGRNTINENNVVSSGASPDPAQLENRVRTDFLWSIANGAE